MSRTASCPLTNVVISRSRLMAVFAVACANVLVACAASGPYRSTLSKEELQSMKPEIAEHVSCVAEKAGPGDSAIRDVNLIVKAAATQCRGKLEPFSVKARTFGLSDSARERYVKAVEDSSRVEVAKIIQDRRARSARRATGAESPKGQL